MEHNNVINHNSIESDTVLQNYKLMMFHDSSFYDNLNNNLSRNYYTVSQEWAFVQRYNSLQPDCSGHHLILHLALSNVTTQT